MGTSPLRIRSRFSKNRSFSRKLESLPALTRLRNSWIRQLRLGEPAPRWHRWTRVGTLQIRKSRCPGRSKKMKYQTSISAVLIALPLFTAMDNYATAEPKEAVSPPSLSKLAEPMVMTPLMDGRLIAVFGHTGPNGHEAIGATRRMAAVPGASRRRSPRFPRTWATGDCTMCWPTATASCTSSTKPMPKRRGRDSTKCGSTSTT